MRTTSCEARLSGEARRAVQFMNLPVSVIEEDGNIRDAAVDESVGELAMSLREQGMHHPVTVRKSGASYLLLLGHRRLQAARAAGLDTVPARVIEGGFDAGEIVVAQLTENVHRRDLTAIEKARAIDRLRREKGWSAAEIAVKLRISPSLVSKLLALLDLPESVQAQVASGRVSLTTGYALSQASSAESQEELAEEAATGGLTREGVVRRTRKDRTRGRRRRPPQRIKLVVLPIGEGCQIKAPERGLTVRELGTRLSALVGRINALERQEMELAEAVKALDA